MLDVINIIDIIAIIIDWFLKIAGAISVFITIVRSFWVAVGSSVEFIGNVKLVVYSSQQDLTESEESVIPQYRYLGNQDYAQYNLFKPEGIVIKNVVINKLSYSEDSSALVKSEKLDVIKEVTPYNPLCVVAERPELFAQYSLSWKSEYGAKATYYFCPNGYSGKYNRSSFEYSYGIGARIRKVLGLR